MDMTLTSIEVDGTLRNPYVLAAFLLWSVLLVIVGLALGRTVRRQGPFVGQRFAVLLVLCFMSRVSTRLLAMLIYDATSRATIGVGFWGGPPFWAPFAVAAGAGAVGWLAPPARPRAAT